MSTGSTGKLDHEASHTLWLLLTAIAGVEDEWERVRLAVTGLPSLLPCIISGVGLRDEEGNCRLLVQREGQVLTDEERASMDCELDPLACDVLKEGRVYTGDVPPSLREQGVRNVVVAPLQTLHTQIGVVMVGREDPEEPGSQETFLIRALAQQLAIGIENLRLRRLTKRRSDTLLEINNATVANLDRQSLFDAVARALGRVFRFDRSSLTLFDPVRKYLTLTALTGPQSTTGFLEVGTMINYKGSHLREVIDDKKSLRMNDLLKEEKNPTQDLLIREGIRSYMTVPLVVKDRAIGTLNIGSGEPGQYSADDIEFLAEVGKQLGLAFENMLAFEEIAVLKSRLEKEKLYLQEEIKTEHNFEEIIGKAQAIRKALKSVETVAPTGASVLITGETGTGKELIARAIHDLSTRKDMALVKVNCAAIPAGLIESEFFGHEKGAFTGALAQKVGKFELADGGTIFLDEIGELPLDLQSKLLRVLQEGETERVGGNRTINVDVRVIAATNRDLEKEVADGRFRADLFYRLNVFPISIPALRERKADIPVLVQYFTNRYAKKMGRTINRVSPENMAALEAYAWPGNVRELAHVVERAVILSRGPELELKDWMPRTPVGGGGEEIVSLDEAQKRHILRALEATDWKVSGDGGAAEILGIKPTTLEARMKKLGIKRPV